MSTGEDDNIGRLNLLTPTRVAAAGKEIKSGEIVPVNLPLNTPEVPAFGRESFHHEIKTLAEDLAYDDLYTLNTQSGTQFDGFRHFAHMASGTFYNNTKGSDIVGPGANHKCSVHHWAQHGIAGRGILLDYRGYAHKKGINYDPYEYYPISFEELKHCAADQGLDIRPAAQGGDVKIGDILFVRTGWVEAYHSKPPQERNELAVRPHVLGKDDGQRFAGLSQEERVLDWLHDSYFSAVAGDAPAFEAWPTHEGESWTLTRAREMEIEADLFSCQQITICTSTYSRSGACRWAKCWIWRNWRRCVVRRTDGRSFSRPHQQTCLVSDW